MTSEEIRAVLEQIDDAFAGEDLPPDDRIVYDNSGYHLECNEIREKFLGRHWRDLSVEDLEGESDSLAFFTPEAFRFYLPAFLRVALLDPERAELIPDTILSSLAKPDLEGFWKDRKESILAVFRERGLPEKMLEDLEEEEPPELDSARRERIEALTEDQKRVILRFVSYLKKHRKEEFGFGELELVEEALRC